MLKKNIIFKKKSVKKFKLTLLFLFSLQLSYAQEIVPSTGGDANGTGGTSSFTVGQVFYTSNASSAGFVSQGVQQVHAEVDPKYKDISEKIDKIRNILYS